MLLRFGLIILLLSFAHNCFALTISGVTHTATSISAVGVAFGTGPSQVIFENFETGTAEEELNNIDSSWKEYNGGIVYKNNYVHAGLLSAGKITSETSFSSNNKDLSPSDTLYYSYWYRLSVSGDLTTSVQYKAGRICSSDAAGYPYNGKGTVGLTNIRPYYETGAGYFNYWNDAAGESVFYHWYDDTGIVPELGQWHMVEMYIEASTPGIANGYFYTSIDGVIVDHNNEMTRATGEIFQYSSILLGAMLDSISTGTYFVNVDDVYASNSQARGFICVNADGTGHREIQIPISWTDTSASFTLNKGTFNDGDTVYLFVIDSNGNASNGYPIVLGSESINTTISGNLQTSGPLQIKVQ